MAGIWTAFLKVEPIGHTDNFFELGGHSLLATQLISYLGDLFQTEFPLRRFLQDATVRGIAAALASAPEGGDAAEVIARAYEAFHSSTTDLADSAARVVRQTSERTSGGQPSAGSASTNIISVPRF